MKPVVRWMCAALMLVSAPAFASGSQEEPKQMDWKFDGVFGTFDRPALQRGFQVYKEVCSACHSLKRVSFRQLQGIGFSENEVKALARTYTIHDGPNDMGEMFDRPGKPSDMIPGPYANEQAARASNNGALPPDQSLLIKAREDGANYVYSILTGYGPAPEDVTVPPGAYYNSYMDGHIIKMAPPLRDGSVTYQDSATNPTVDQQAHDLVNFLQWASEPEMEQRKEMGLHVMLFLAAMTTFFYLVKKRIWSNLH